MAIVEPINPPRNMADEKEMERWTREISRRQSYNSYAGNPTNNVTPRWVGERCLNSVASDWYMSTGPLAANWKKIT